MRLALFLCSLVLLSPATVRTALPAPQHAPELLVVNQHDHTVSFIDPASAQQAATFDEQSITGHEVAVTPDGQRAFVPIYGDSGVGRPGTDGQTMQVIDVASRKLLDTVDFGHGVRPHCVVYDPGRNLLYVTTELDQAITIVDPATDRIVGRIPTTQPQSHMLVLSHDGRFGYTANVGPGTVSVLDLNTRKPLAVIPISSDTQRISISNDDRSVFTADQAKPRLAVIDTASRSVRQWIALPAIAYGTASTPDGRWLLATMRPTGSVAVIDAHTLTLVRTIPTGGIPTEIIVRPDGKVAYVSCGTDVVAIDLARMEVATHIHAGAGADGLAWAR